MLSRVTCHSHIVGVSSHTAYGNHHWPVLPARWVAEVALAEHHPVEGGGELEADHHAGLLARHVKAGDGGHVGGPAPGPRHAPIYAAALAERLNLTQRKLKHKTIMTDWYSDNSLKDS